MNLQDLLQNSQLEQINTNATDARAMLAKALKRINFAKKNLSDTGDEELIYNHLYDSLRLSCTALLYFNKLRVKTSGPGHHKTTIEVAGKLMNNELAAEFKRIEKMRKKRNILEYGKDMSISETELKQAMKDSINLYERINELIVNKDSRLPL